MMDAWLGQAEMLQTSSHIGTGYFCAWEAGSSLCTPLITTSPCMDMIPPYLFPVQQKSTLTRQEQHWQSAFYSKLQHQLGQEVRKRSHVTWETAELFQTTTSNPFD